MGFAIDRKLFPGKKMQSLFEYPATPLDSDWQLPAHIPVPFCSGFGAIDEGKIETTACYTRMLTNIMPLFNILKPKYRTSANKKSRFKAALNGAYKGFNLPAPH